jgi:hypothetical protein
MSKLENETRKDTQITFYKAIAAPMLMYGSENWALNRSERRKIERAQMRFIRRVSGYTVTDRVRNAFQINSLEERIQDYKTSGIITS